MAYIPVVPAPSRVRLRGGVARYVHAVSTFSDGGDVVLHQDGLGLVAYAVNDSRTAACKAVIETQTARPALELPLTVRLPPDAVLALSRASSGKRDDYRPLELELVRHPLDPRRPQDPVGEWALSSPQDGPLGDGELLPLGVPLPNLGSVPTGPLGPVRTLVSSSYLDLLHKADKRAHYTGPWEVGTPRDTKGNPPLVCRSAWATAAFAPLRLV